MFTSSVHFRFIFSSNCVIMFFIFSNKEKLIKNKNDLQPEDYKCGVCERQCRDYPAYTARLRTHSGEKPYACTFDQCGMKFAMKFFLNRHMLIHTDAIRM